QESAPRLLDARIDGHRRFYLQRGHTSRAASLGVQNWDDPLALLLAWQPWAARRGLHLLAGPSLWCGERCAPPRAWLAGLCERAGIDLAAEEAEGEGTEASDGVARASCPHGEGARVEIRLDDGPGGGFALRLCAACGRRARQSSGAALAVHVQTRHAGPDG